jgi:hypothetical protein
MIANNCNYHYLSAINIVEVSYDWACSFDVYFPHNELPYYMAKNINVYMPSKVVDIYSVYYVFYVSLISYPVFRNAIKMYD